MTKSFFLGGGLVHAYAHFNKRFRDKNTGIDDGNVGRGESRELPYSPTHTKGKFKV